jgi:DNA polymerase
MTAVTAQELHAVVMELRSFFEGLRDGGVVEVTVAPRTADLPPCPPGVAGTGVGGNAPCRPERLDEVRADLGDCQRCPLCRGRRQIVFGVGNPAASVVFVGEAPGREEDESGEPFVGEAGRLLDRILFAMGLERNQVYICNVIKCRPPANRDPVPEEIAACEPFLKHQLAAIRPHLIVTLGRFATQTLLQDETPISRLRGSWREYEGIPLLPTFHPAYLLRNPAEKREVWEDMKQVMQRLANLRGD